MTGDQFKILAKAGLVSVPGNFLPKKEYDEWVEREARLINKENKLLADLESELAQLGEIE